MKIWPVLVVTVFALSLIASEGQITATKEQLKKADEVVSLFKSPYVKFDDGVVVSIRRSALIKEGVIFPKLYTNKFGWRIVKQYKIMDNTPIGCRIEPVNIYGEYYDNTTDTDMFVDDLSGLSGRMYGAIFLRRSKENFTYSTAIGGSRTIPRYEYGMSATKQEFDEYIKTINK